MAISVLLYRWRLSGVARGVAEKVQGGYFAALAAGAVLGAWASGSFNTLREHQPALSHSVAGALIGAIIGVEIYKLIKGVKGSTGGVFVGSFTLGVIVGRLGCFFAGFADDTYGTPTHFPWGVDLGDGVSRHPVQIYESASMALFLRRLSPWAEIPPGLGYAARLLRHVRLVWFAKVRLGVPEALSKADRPP